MKLINVILYIFRLQLAKKITSSYLLVYMKPAWLSVKLVIRWYSLKWVLVCEFSEVDSDNLTTNGGFGTRVSVFVFVQGYKHDKRRKSFAGFEPDMFSFSSSPTSGWYLLWNTKLMIPRCHRIACKLYSSSIPTILSWFSGLVSCHLSFFQCVEVKNIQPHGCQDLSLSLSLFLFTLCDWKACTWMYL